MTGTEAAPALTAEDLAATASLSDTTKDEAEIWSEIQAEKAAKDTTAEAVVVEEEKPAEVETPKPDVKQETASAPASIDWTKAPPAFREAHEREVKALSHKARSSAGRIGYLQRQLNELNKSGSQPDVSPSREKLKTVETDFPEVKPVIDALEETRTQVTADRDSRRQAAESELATLKAAEVALVDETHPDWRQVFKTHGGPNGKLAQYVNDPDQPRWVYEAWKANSDALTDADAANRLIAAFKKHIAGETAPATATTPARVPAATNPSLNEKRQRQLQGSATPPPKSGSRPVLSGVPDDADEETLWKARQAEKAAQRARA